MKCYFLFFDTIKKEIWGELIRLGFIYKPVIFRRIAFTGEAPNSPTHSSINSNHGSNNMVFAEGGSITPTASPTRRDYILAKGVNAQTHNVEKTHRQKGASAGGGREVSGRVGSPTRHQHSSQSSLSHKGVTTPPGGGYPPSLPSPYGVNARSNDFIHQPGDFNNPVDLDPRYRRKDKHHRKHRHKSPTSPSGGSERSHSPGALSAGSRRSQESRNQSFKKAISNKGSSGVPLADEEDLSPVSPDTPTREQIEFAPRTTPGVPGRGAEIIPMGNYHNKSRNRFRDSGIADTHIGSPDSNPKQTLLPHHGGGGGPGAGTAEPRPPVEGRDSVRRRHPYSPTGPAPLTTPDRQNGNFISGGERPGLKPLPLRNVQRPDGQSPEHQTTETSDPNANRQNPNTPDSTDLSPILRKTKLFDNDSKASSAVHTPIDVPDEYEYDDYMPNLPGSYFTMDPHAYTLTWSNQQPWNHHNSPHKGPPPATATGDPSVNESHA